MNNEIKARTDAEVRGFLNDAIAAGRINEEGAQHVLWFHGYVCENNLGNEEAGKAIDYSSATISTLFGGKYAASDWSRVVKQIAAFRKRETAKVCSLNVGFVETEISRLIFNICDSAHADHLPAYIFGASQIGKTRCLTEYARRANSSRVVYVSCGSGMSHLQFAQMLAKKAHLRGVMSKASASLIDEVKTAFDSSTLLILDEFSKILATDTHLTSRKIVEYVRDIYDESHCGLVLAMTPVGFNTLLNGPDNKVYEQFFRRGILQVGLPDVPPVCDIVAFAKSFGLNEPQGEMLSFVKNLMHSRGQNVFLAHLQKAYAFAKKSGAAMSWDLYMKAAKSIESLRNIKNEY